MSEPVSRRRRTVGRATVRRFVARAKPPPHRGVATPHNSSTRPLPAPEATGPVFVDHSGRRARVLRRIMYCLVLAALVALAVLWLSQASVLGLEVR